MDIGDREKQADQVGDEAVELAGRAVFRVDNGGSDAPLTDGERDSIRLALQAAAPAIEARAVDRFVEKLLGEKSDRERIAAEHGTAPYIVAEVLESAIDRAKGRG